RDKLVTGVQTCALPIYFIDSRCKQQYGNRSGVWQITIACFVPQNSSAGDRDYGPRVARILIGVVCENATDRNDRKRFVFGRQIRSEERRVGKECRSRVA